MANAKMVTDDELERRLVAARDAEKRARARIAILKRSLRGASRQAETQRRCALGGTLLALAARGTEADLRLVAYVRRYLVENPPHESNRIVLAGTAFAIGGSSEADHE